MGERFGHKQLLEQMNEACAVERGDLLGRYFKKQR